MSAVAMPRGWGFRPFRKPLAPRSDRAVALLALRRAPAEVLDLSAGLIARDLSALLGVEYRTAYRVAQAMKQRPRPRRAW